MSAGTCPSWCTLPAGHDPENAADGGRVHYPPPFGVGVALGWNDDGTSDEPWYFEASMDVGGDAAAVAAALTSYAADLVRAAGWLKGQA